MLIKVCSQALLFIFPHLHSHKRLEEEKVEKRTKRILGLCRRNFELMEGDETIDKPVLVSNHFNKALLVERISPLALAVKVQSNLEWVGRWAQRIFSEGWGYQWRSN